MKWLRGGKVPFFEATPGNRSSGDGVGPVAQRIRARGYEPRCRGFESLLAQPFQKGRTFPSGGGSRKIMIGIADQKLWNLGVGLLSKWNGLTFSFDFLFFVNGKIFKNCLHSPSAFFCFTPRNSASARLGQNSRASTSISSIRKKSSSSLIINMFTRGNCGLSGESMTASLMHY